MKYDRMPHLLSLNMPPTSCPTSNFIFFFYNPVSLISEAHMCMALSHPLDHEKPTSGHTLKKETMISSLSSHNMPVIVYSSS